MSAVHLMVRSKCVRHVIQTVEVHSTNEVHYEYSRECAVKIRHIINAFEVVQ